MNKLIISPAISLPIDSESVTINITPSSVYGELFDVARFTTDIVLRDPLPTDQDFLIPKLDVLSQQGPIMTLSDGTVIPFDFDPVDKNALDNMKQQLRQDVEAFLTNDSGDPVKAKESKDLIDYILSLEVGASTQKVPAGTRFIKFSYTKSIAKDPATGLYALNSIVPLASFTAQNQGSRLHILVAMPFTPSPQNAQGKWVNPQGGQGDLVLQDIQGRKVLSAFWQNDPELTITYQY